MSEDYLAQAQPTQTWNTVRGVWEKQGIANLLCEHWELFSETWQTSGTMRNGKVYELPTQGPRITDSECSSSPILRTPAASEAERGHQPEDKSKARGGQLTLSGQMMTYFPTPNTMDHLPARTPEQKELNKGKGGYANVRETVVNDLMPTPVASEGTKASAAQSSSRRAETGQVFLTNIIHDVAVENGHSVPLGNLLPTTRAQNGEDRNNKIWARDSSKPQNLENALAVTLLPTTTASDWKGPNHSGSGSASTTGISTAVELLPTPTAVDGNTVAKSELDANDPKHTLKVADQVLTKDKLLPTLRGSDGYERRNQKTMDRIARDGGDMTMVTLARTQTDWGKFEPAIRRWEQTLGRPAPLPTKPDGKDGAHRLSSKFTEWMMGLPEGWITGVGLKRNDELKACGNGVVPQQAELALRILLEGVTLPTGGGQVNLPTPTVSDTYTDNLKSTQQKEGSMHSVTLPQAVRWVSNEHSSK